MECRFGKSGCRGKEGRGRWKGCRGLERRRCDWSRAWSLTLGGVSYPTSQPHLSIDLFLGHWSCCEVRCKLEKCDNLNATSCVEYVVVVVDDDGSLDSSAKSDTGEGQFKNDYRSTSSESTTLENDQSI